MVNLYDRTWLPVPARPWSVTKALWFDMAKTNHSQFVLKTILHTRLGIWMPFCQEQLVFRSSNSISSSISEERERSMWTFPWAASNWLDCAQAGPFMRFGTACTRPDSMTSSKQQRVPDEGKCVLQNGVKTTFTCKAMGNHKADEITW